MEFSTERIEKRIDFIQMELIHSDRMDGWTKSGFESELKDLLTLIETLNVCGVTYNKYFN